MAAVRTTKRRIAGSIAAATTLALAVGAGASLPAQAAPAPEGRVLQAGAEGAVPGSYIVALKETAGFTASATQGRKLIAGYGGRITRTYTSALNGYAAQLSGAEARRLAADPAVASGARVQNVHTNPTPTNPPAGLARGEQPKQPRKGA
ncbi:protease inhibitor I9 family protein, partial [Streptomyces microflavus]|uniref:protease inhibitor I9 family protein n=1 Tax=Streptomyces microflavus TaxID=1919 RepID=UPI003699F415